MKIFFGSAIQVASNRKERDGVHRVIIDAIKVDEVSNFVLKIYSETVNAREFKPELIKGLINLLS